VRVDLPNSLLEREGRRERERFHRLYAEGRVALESPAVLSVPRAAVLQAGAQPIMFLDRGGGAYERRAVRLGRVGDTRAEVLEGLSEGEKVVTAGNLLLDAQAELMRDPSAPATDAAAATPSSAPGVPMPEPLAALAADLSEALAREDLAAFNAATHRTHAVIPEAEKALATDPALEPFAARLRASGHLAEAADLPSARKAFHPFVTTVADLLLKAPPGTGDYRAFECPMTAEAFPGAPVAARWVQRGTAARNPYFGKAMLDCGSEVKR